MVLHYKFEYFSNNNLLINSLETCAKVFNLHYSIIKDKNEIHFYVESSVETMEMFSTVLSQRVPMSVFLNTVEVHSLSSFPSDVQHRFGEFHSLTFCTQCLKNVEDKKHQEYYNPFIFCKQCGQDLGTPHLKLFERKKEIVKMNHIEYFETVAKLLNDGKRVKIRTLSGEFVFYKLENHSQPLHNSLKLLCTNLNEIDQGVNASKQEVIALASIEKPIITLELNPLFRTKNQLKDTYMDVRYVNDMLLYLLSVELKKYSISFLAYESNASFDAHFTFETSQPYELISVPHISINQSNRALILHSNQYDKKLNTIYQQFEQKNKAHFMVLLAENELLENSILNLYSSTLHDDGFSFYSTQFEGVLDIFTLPMPQSVHEIFDAIKENEVGLKLINNYEKKFPQLYKKLLQSDVKRKNVHSIYALWQWVCLILDFEEDVLKSAHKAVLQKAPRVDYQLIQSNKMFNKTLDVSKLIQSGISYKLAGVDTNLLALGYVESYIDFINDCIDRVHQDFPIDAVSFCGDMISDTLISYYVHRNISKSYKIYYNKDFPIQIN